MKVWNIAGQTIICVQPIKMSEKEKRIFELAITTDKPYVVIGEMTDLSEKTIRNTMSKLYKLIRNSDDKALVEENLDKEEYEGK